MDLSPILTVSRPFLSDIYHGQIQHFQETIIGWKYRLGFGDFPELTVKSFNRVRGIDQTSDSFRILKYVERFAQLSFHDFAILGYFPLHFSSKLSSSANATSSVGAAYTRFRSAISGLISL